LKKNLISVCNVFGVIQNFLNKFFIFRLFNVLVMSFTSFLMLNETALVFYVVLLCFSVLNGFLNHVILVSWVFFLWVNIDKIF
jgi:hypothetical protein